MKLLLSKLTTVLNDEEKVKLLKTLSNPIKTTTVLFLNAHAVNISQKCNRNFNLFYNADYLLRDGAGVKLAMSVHDIAPGLNLNGTDLIPQFLRMNTGKSMIIIGTTEPWLSSSANAFDSMGLKVLTVIDGYRSTSEYLSIFAAHKADIVLLCLGMTKQEELANLLKLTYPDQQTTIICGGAICDFVAQKYPRAPYILRECGLEWLYRLYKEPTRLFRRYVVGNPLFVYHALSSGLRNYIHKIKMR